MQGQIVTAAAIIIYAVIGGVFPIGQFVAAEIGKYEIWSHKRRLIVGSALYFSSFAPTVVILVLVDWELRLLPWIFASVLVCEKFLVSQLNRLMPGRFQPTDEELKERYGELFKVDLGEVNAVLEDDFTRRLGFGLPSDSKKRPSFLKGEDLADETGLKEAVESYLEKERRRTRAGGK